MASCPPGEVSEAGVQDPVWVELGIPGGFFLRGLFKLGWLITPPHTSRIVPLSELVKEKLRRL